MLSADEANRLYFRQAYRTGEHGWEAEEPSPYAAAFLKQLKRIVPGGRLLDIGCGEGRHTILAANLGFKATGIDYEPLALTRARRFARAGKAVVVFRWANVFRMPVRSASYDIVLDYGCLHHQRKRDWQAYIGEVLRVLRPHGFYILSVFSPRFYLFQKGRRLWHIAEGAYRRCFTRSDIMALAGDRFEVVELNEEKGPGRGFWHALLSRRQHALGDMVACSENTGDLPVAPTRNATFGRDP